MQVEVSVAGGREVESRPLEVAGDVATLRELLAALVRHELAAYTARSESSRTLQVLTPADLAWGVDTGTYNRERRAVPAAPAEADAIQRALEAFTDGLFFVFVDEVQVVGLDAPLAVRPDSTVRLIRLVALVGG